MDDTVLFLRVVFHSMAVFGLTWVFRYTDGPGHVFLRLRKLAGIEYFEEMDGVTGQRLGLVEEVPDDKILAGLFGCFWCLATWMSLFLTMITFPNIGYKALILLWWGSIGVSGFMHELVTK